MVVHTKLEENEVLSKFDPHFLIRKLKLFIEIRTKLEELRYLLPFSFDPSIVPLFQPSIYPLEKDLCLEDNGKCDHSCQSVGGKEIKCSCNNNMVLQLDGKSCAPAAQKSSK